MKLRPPDSASYICIVIMHLPAPLVLTWDRRLYITAPVCALRGSARLRRSADARAEDGEWVSWGRKNILRVRYACKSQRRRTKALPRMYVTRGEGSRDESRVLRKRYGWAMGVRYNTRCAMRYAMSASGREDMGQGPGTTEARVHIRVEQREIVAGGWDEDVSCNCVRGAGAS